MPMTTEANTVNFVYHEVGYVCVVCVPVWYCSMWVGRCLKFEIRVECEKSVDWIFSVFRLWCVVAGAIRCIFVFTATAFFFLFFFCLLQLAHLRCPCFVSLSLSLSASAISADCITNIYTNREKELPLPFDKRNDRFRWEFDTCFTI